MSRIKGAIESKMDDNNPKTFPLDRNLYADFSHDDPMTSISAALGFFQQTPQLSNKTITPIDPYTGFTAARTVPFAARFAVEKMMCPRGEMIRVLVNGRVMPLDFMSDTCKNDQDNLCPKDVFVDYLRKRSDALQMQWINGCH